MGFYLIDADCFDVIFGLILLLYNYSVILFFFLVHVLRG